MRQNLPTANHLPLHIVLSLSPDPPVWPLFWGMFCQHHLPQWSRRAQKQTVFTFLQVANATEASGSNNPSSLTSLHHQHLVSTNKLHLSSQCIPVNQSRRFFHLTRYFGTSLLFNICKQCITN